MEQGETRAVLNELGRGVVGAFLVAGLTFFYTMETWWLAWTLPWLHLLIYTLVGLAIVLAVTRYVGYQHGTAERDNKSAVELATEFTGLALQSAVAAFIVLAVIGIIDAGTELHVVVRLVMIQIVPLGLGAALANQLFAETEEDADEEAQFPENLAIFALGATFVSVTIAPTEEMALIAAHMDWIHHLVLLVLTLSVVHLTLYELEFQGQGSRGMGAARYEVGTAITAYVVGVCVASLLLWGFGQFDQATLPVVVEKTVVLSFPAGVGASGAEVVL